MNYKSTTTTTTTIKIFTWKCVKMGRILKKRRSTVQGGNSNLPIDQLIYTKKIKNVYIEIQRVENVETFNLKSFTDDASLISRRRLFHSPTRVLTLAFAFVVAALFFILNAWYIINFEIYI